MIGQTRRNAPRLLSVVNKKPHATQDDHVDALPTPPTTNSTRSSASRVALDETEEDINRDPESSDDGENVQPQIDAPVEFKILQRISNERPAIPTPAFRNPIGSSPVSITSKRSNNSDGPSSDGDEIFGSQGSKRPRKAYSDNIHAPAPASTSRSRLQKYGRSSQSRPQKKGSEVGFKQAGKPKGEKTAGPAFQTSKGADVFKFQGRGAAPEFRVPPLCARSGSRSPSLSPLSSAPSSPGFEEVSGLNLPDAQRYDPKTECASCRSSVDLFLKEQFEDEFAPGKHMSYKWRQRFCRYHKQHEAKQSWQERGYPNINWDDLEMPMASFHSHLEKVIAGKTPSYYRDDLTERLKGRTKTAVQAVGSEGVKGGAQVGYYGPRGEKIMTDHIIAHLSDRLRKQAAKDDLVAASGISGGVSGFINAVLVPELATQLIQEDLKISAVRAQEIAAESAELGDLLNPEIEERVDRVDLMGE